MKRTFRTTGDLVAAGILVVAVAVGFGVVHHYSDARATTSEPGEPGPPLPPEPGGVPETLGQVWQARSGATTGPVLVADTLVTADGRDVVGRDPLTGGQRWRYARDIELCAVTGVWNGALAVYRRDLGCSEVTHLDGATGRRGAQRNGDAPLDTRLITDSRHVAATGRSLMEVWRSDLVRTLHYGEVPTPVQPYAVPTPLPDPPPPPPTPGQPNNQPRPGCVFDTFTLVTDRLAITEHCPDSTGARVTVQKPDPKEPAPPEEYFSVTLPEAVARIVSVSDRATAVVAGDPARLVVLDDRGARTAEHQLSVPVTSTEAVPDVTDGGEVRYWFTGSGTVALAVDGFRPLWTVPDTLGPGTLFAGRLLVPVREGLAVINPENGVRERLIPVDRGGYQGFVRLDHAGPMVFEQRGDILVALR